ncbi:hypothetical protein AB1Y20_002177 [Prymnesium parvum]|uniref:Phytanoyl-dioxygenase n=1 Tax=Prymnesium parvum TaxID=97485 RepID=A0AB34J7R2_PRYPA
MLSLRGAMRHGAWLRGATLRGPARINSTSLAVPDALPSLEALPPLPSPSAALPDALVERFRADGAIVVPSLLPPEWLDALREGVERNLANPGPLCDEHAAAQGTGGRFHDDQFLWMRHPEFKHFVWHSGAAAIAARALGSASAHIFYDQLMVKEPGTVAPTPWHNDTSYWQLKGEQICSIWVALDDVPAERGLGYVKGSHKWGLRHAITNFSGAAHSERNVYTDAGQLEPVPDIAAGEASGEYEVLRWDMKAGDALIFASAAMHGAPGNASSSGARRRGYATRWCGDDVTFARLPGTMHDGWKAAGYDCGLDDGAPICCELHPNILAKTQE